MNPPPPQFGIPPAMQVVSSRHRNRRKGPIPITKKSQDQIWLRTLDALGLETLHPKCSLTPPALTTTSHSMDAPTPPTVLVARKSIPDLPLEVQRNIFRHATSPDLIALSLVSKKFRSIAAEELYRTFHIVFPDEDDFSNDSSIDGLAGGLDTFVTSEYDYPQHLREIILETLSGGDKGERTYKDYLYNVSCGKFMNTLLLLTLRRAKALETFKWDIRVELSRQVFRALHQIESLNNLHLRMQAGASIYQSPPAIGGPPPPAPTGLPFPLIALPPPPPPPHHNGPIPILPPSMPMPNSNSYTMGYKLAQKAHQKQMKSTPSSVDAPPTLSGFKNLKTLSILDIDTHEYMDELKACIGASPNLKSLRLSFSETFANKSRRPPPEIHSDDESDQEDEFGQIIPPPGTIDPSAPTQALKAQEQKKKQDAVLGFILGWEPAAPKAKPVGPPRTAIVEKEVKVSEEPKDPKDQFIKRLAPWAKRIMLNAQPGSGQSAEGKELLEIIEQACKAYLEGINNSKKSIEIEAETSTAKGTPASSITSGNDSAPGDSVVTDGPGLFDEPKEKAKPTSDEPGISNPEDIDMDEPEIDIQFENSIELLSDLSPTEPAPVENQDISATSSPQSEPANDAVSKLMDLQALSVSKDIDVAQKQKVLAKNYKDFKHIEEALKLDIDRLNAGKDLGPVGTKTVADLAALNAEWTVVKEKLELVSRILGTSKDDKTNPTAFPPELDSTKSGMNEYLRKTRGLPLTNLEMYLVPVRSNVISQTIDLRCLRSITLLNVGPQNPLWATMLAKNNMLSLPLQKIYTDNVTLPFLVFASQLEKMIELIMVERAPKQKVESTAAKTTVTIEQIRKFVLKKHAATLKVLVIKNKATADWDLNIKTAMLLCRRAKKLEELACIYGSKVLHSLLQFMPGMESLRAIHAYQFRDGDNCLWVTEGSRKFTVDMVAHNPQMKLEYIALDNSVDRIVRRKPEPKTEASKKGKGKAKVEPNHMLTELTNSAMGGISSVPTWEAAIASGNADWESSDEEDDDGSFAKGLRLETLEGCLFWNIPGVRIFEKDVLTGAL